MFFFFFVRGRPFPGLGWSESSENSVCNVYRQDPQKGHRGLQRKPAGAAQLAQRALGAEPTVVMSIATLARRVLAERTLVKS